MTPLTSEPDLMWPGLPLQKTERYLYTWTNLVGEVGGSMGFFLGASLVSVFETGLKYVRKIA